MSSTGRGRSRRSADDAPRPEFVRPMECTPVAEIPDDAAKWIYEVKLDGYRCCGVVRANGKATLYSRYGNAWPERFPKVQEALAAIGDPVVLDGEIVALDREGRPSFQELQNWQSTRLPIVFYVFDVIHWQGRDLRGLPIEERKQVLDEVATRFREPLRLAPMLPAQLGAIVPELKKHGLEGIVAKRRGTRYAAGERSQWWVKHRFNALDEFVAGGFLPGPNGVDRLLVGSWEGDRLVFVEKIRAGFNPYNRREVFEALRPLVTKQNPFTGYTEPGAIWVRPEQKVEIEFVERTASGKLRHAYFRRLL